MADQDRVAARRRYVVTVVFWLDADTDGEAHSVVSEFAHAFPEQAGDRAHGDVLVQDTEDDGEPEGADDDDDK